jgi:hypothetical protein
VDPLWTCFDKKIQVFVVFTCRFAQIFIVLCWYLSHFNFLSGTCFMQVFANEFRINEVFIRRITQKDKNEMVTRVTFQLALNVTHLFVYSSNVKIQRQVWFFVKCQYPKTSVILSGTHVWGYRTYCVWTGQNLGYNYEQLCNDLQSAWTATPINAFSLLNFIILWFP